MILAKGSGASDCEVLQEYFEDPEEELTLLAAAKRLLEERGEVDAVALLAAAPFQVRVGTNHFGDEFLVLHGSLPTADYERLRQQEAALRMGAKEIQRTLDELHVPVRFVVVDVDRNVAGWSPPGYECETAAIGEGGYARVHRTRVVATDEIVALKRPKGRDDEEAKARLRREIQEQRRMDHPHVMPVLDHGADYSWFTMPFADTTLSGAVQSLSERDALEVVEQVASGLEAAHALALVHRDVTPVNILRATFAEGSRWVLADWGLVRRPPGMTSTVRTVSGQPFGTLGFIAPEAMDAGHSADARADVYSLGRVLGFLLTREWPKPNIAQQVEGQCRRLVQQATHVDTGRRIQTMTEFRRLVLARIAEPEGPVAAETPAQLLEAATTGRTSAINDLLDLALGERDDPDLWLDYIGQLPRHAMDHIAGQRPEDGTTLVEQLLHHAVPGYGWDRRSFDYANDILERMMWLAESAESHSEMGLLEDAARALFEGDARWERFPQRRR